MKNGVLLSKAEASGFTLLVTGDQNLEHQQNMANRKLGIVVLGSISNAIEDLLPLVPKVLVAIDRCNQHKSGELRAPSASEGQLPNPSSNIAPFVTTHRRAFRNMRLFGSAPSTRQIFSDLERKARHWGMQEGLPSQQDEGATFDHYNDNIRPRGGLQIARAKRITGKPQRSPT